MKKEIVKNKYKAGEIQIENDINNKILLSDIIGKYTEGWHKYYFLDKKEDNVFTVKATIIKLSEITESEEEVIWLGSEIQIRLKGNSEWKDIKEGNYWEYRLKPKAEYTSEIEALQQKAKENGMKVTIAFEKL